MKIYFTRFCLLFAMTGYSLFAKAQWVPVNSTFAAYIKLYVDSTAVNGNLLDTTNHTVVNLQNMTIYDYSIADITGIQYFDALQNLAIQSSQITNVPVLPPNLITFDLENSEVTSISGPFPAGLTALKLYSGNISSLPILPSTLQKLILNDWNAASLPALINLPLQYLEVENSQALQSLPGLPNTLTYLDVNNSTKLSTFPTLPQSLQQLEANSTLMGNLNSFPLHLNYFMCVDCQNLSYLPDVPDTLIDIEVSYSNIRTLGTFPQVMNSLDLSYTPINYISYLPDTINDYLGLSNLPDIAGIYQYGWIFIGGSVDISSSSTADVYNFLSQIRNIDPLNGIGMYASNDSLYSVPMFEAQMQVLDLSGNQLDSLPAEYGFEDMNCGQYGYCLLYPVSYGASFKCENCGLTSINPDFFNADQLAELDLANNKLTNINWLPSAYGGNIDYGNNPQFSDAYLNLSNNQISNISAPVNTYIADFTNNEITCLPALSYDMQKLYVQGNPINCLPNLPDSGFICDKSIAVCQPGNSNNCPVFSTAKGIVFNDMNANGLRDPGDTALPNYVVMLNPVNALHESNATGTYTFQCGINTYYTIHGLPTYPYRRITTGDSTVYFTAYNQVDSNDNIGISILSNVNDMLVEVTDITGTRPGFEDIYHVTAKNEGTTIQNGNVVMYFDTALLYQSSTPAGTVSGNTITWPVSQLEPLQMFTADVNLLIPVPVPLGSLINTGVYALCNLPDTTPYDNHDTLTETAFGSYDPNNKTVSPATGLSQQEIAAGKYLDYTVRFQNTGTGSAINIRVEDTLNTMLDLTTFEMIDASSKYTWTIDNRVLKVYFNNIQLPDSGHDEPGSHGFLRFRIRPLANTPAGQQVVNKAYIYFDFNQPVVTNIAIAPITTYFIQQPQSQVLCSGEPLLLTVSTSNEVLSEQWYLNGIATGIATDTLYVDSSTTANSGLYTCQIITDKGETYYSNPAGVRVYDHMANASFGISYDTISICSNQNGSTDLSITAYNVKNDPGPTVLKWYLNDSLITPYNDSTVFIQTVFKAGDYITGVLQVPCMSPMPTKSIYIKLVQVDTASITISPKAPHMCPGAAVTFSAATTGFTNPFVSWYLNNTYMGYGTSYTYTNPQPTDNIVAEGGTYGVTCPPVISQNGGLFVSDTAHIISDSLSAPTPSSISISAVSPLFCSGFFNAYKAMVTNPGLSVHYQWLFNGAPVGKDTAYVSGTYFNQGDSLKCRLVRTLCTEEDTFYSPTLYLFDDTTIQSSVTITTYSAGGICSEADIGCNFANTPPGTSASWYFNGNFLTNLSYAYFWRTNHADTVECVIDTHQPCGDSIFYSNVIILPALSTSNSGFVITSTQPSNVCPGTYIPVLAYYYGDILWYVNGSYTSSGTDFDEGNVYGFTINNTTMNVFALAYNYDCGTYDTSQTLTFYADTTTQLQLQVSISPVAFCSGQTPEFIATHNLGGDVYWDFPNSYVASVGDIAIPTATIPEGGKVICQLVTTCYNNLVITDTVTVHYTNEVPVVHISLPADELCGGNPVKTFTATSQYGGSYPAYQWNKNGVSAGGNSNTYIDSALAVGDRIYCVLTSDNPCAIPPTATSDTITMNNGVTFSPTIRISALQQNACSGTPVTFSAAITGGGSFPSYQWQINNVPVDSNTATFTTPLNDSDIVSCTLTSSSGCASPDTVTSNSYVSQMTPSVTAAIAISTNTDTICAGTSVQFNAVATNPGTTPVYQWFINKISAGNNPNFTTNSLQNADIVKCVLTSNATCVADSQTTSNNIPVVVNAKPGATPISIGGSTAICQGDTVALSETVAGVSYLWSNNDTSSIISVTAAGSYGVSITNSLHCTNSPAPVSISVNPLPAVPIIAQVGDSLVCTPAETYQWYLNNNIITAATQQKLKLEHTGLYMVLVTDNEKCSNQSAPFNGIATYLYESTGDKEIKLFPNPNNGSFVVQFNDDATHEVFITDATGKTISALQVAGSKQFNLGAISSGIYFMRIYTTNYIKNLKFSVTH